MSEASNRTRISTAHSPAGSAAALHPAADEVDAPPAGGLRGLTLGLLLGGLIVGAWRACDKTHARRRSHRSSAVPEPVQNWENEGGTPDPSGD